MICDAITGDTTDLPGTVDISLVGSILDDGVHPM